MEAGQLFEMGAGKVFDMVAVLLLDMCVVHDGRCAVA